MTSTLRLSDILDGSDLPVAELAAARLDGEVTRLGPAFAPIDVPDGTVRRARSLRAALRDRLIADRLTAAWIHGALSVLPPGIEACVRTDARVSALLEFEGTIRQVVIEESELLDLGGVLVTDPLRTIFDLLREPTFDDERGRIIRRLGELCGVGLEACAIYLDGRAHLPKKSLTRARLVRAFTVRDATA